MVEITPSKVDCCPSQLNESEVVRNAFLFFFLEGGGLHLEFLRVWCFHSWEGPATCADAYGAFMTE